MYCVCDITINSNSIFKINIIIIYRELNMKNINCYAKIVFFEILISLIIIIYHDLIDNIVSGHEISYKQKKQYIYFHGGQVSFWNLLHILFFSFLGYICPNSIRFIIFTGIIWEIVELYFEYDFQTVRSQLMCDYVNNCNNKQKIISPKQFWNVYIGKKELDNKALFFCSSGFYGQIIDIISNIIGVYIGSYLATR